MNNSVSTQAYARYTEWLNDPLIDESAKAELRGISEKPSEIEDRFYRELEFGTAGMRGVMGAGIHRMNVYTIGRATQGLARYLHETGQGPVVIAYDSRRHSAEFALECALVLAGNGIKALLFESLRPTPQLSYSVREHRAAGGIVITASHNPPEYNGYKVYGPDGGQLVPEDAERLIGHIQSIRSLREIQRIDQGEAERLGLLIWLGEEADRSYIEAVTRASLNSERLRQGLAADFKIVYTPLHGAGNEPVRAALRSLGFTQVHVVPEQELPDSEFSTVASPNPEESDAFQLAIRLADEVDADLIIGTDPDCDRMGAAVRDSDGEFIVLSGNQSGALMVYYILSQLAERGELPDNGVIINTIVTSELGAAIAARYGVNVVQTLTGFKYIGQKMTEYESSGQYQFLFGYEESYGYLAGTHARDKDAVVASALISEAAAYFRSQGKTLYDVLQDLYAEFGFFREQLESRALKGKEGMEQMSRMMDDWRRRPLADIAGIPIRAKLDYSEGVEGLPKENVIKFIMADDSWFCLRPSGTEPKIKLYFAVKQRSEAEAASKMNLLIRAVMSRIDMKE